MFKKNFITAFVDYLIKAFTDFIGLNVVSRLSFKFKLVFGLFLSMDSRFDNFNSIDFKRMLCSFTVVFELSLSLRMLMKLLFTSSQRSIS